MSSQEEGKPYECRPLDPEDASVLKEKYNKFNNYIRVGPKGYVYPCQFKVIAEDIYKMPIKNDDVFVCSFPRSGTTWTQELVWLIKSGLDFDTACSVTLDSRYNFLEFTCYFEWDAIDRMMEEDENLKDLKIDFLKQIIKPDIKILASKPSPRFIKTHLPLSLLPPSTIDSAKIVYLARDPRDVAVSFYHHNRLFKCINYHQDFKTYWELFTNDLISHCSYFEHLKEAWARRHHPNMLFLFYEELSNDLPSIVRRVAEFLDKQLSEEQVSRLCDHLSFDNFKMNPSVNAEYMRSLGVMNTSESFIRKGKPGGWREYFDEAMAGQADRWIADNLRDTDLRFPHMDMLVNNLTERIQSPLKGVKKSE